MNRMCTVSVTNRCLVQPVRKARCCQIDRFMSTIKGIAGVVMSRDQTRALVIWLPLPKAEKHVREEESAQQKQHAQKNKNKKSYCNGNHCVGGDVGCN